MKTFGFRSRKSIGSSRLRAHHQSLRRLALEPLEDRRLMAVDISISDASAIEGDNALAFIDRFVAFQSGGLARPRGSTFGPDGNGDDLDDFYVASADTNE